MFTGIIKEIGTVRAFERSKDIYRLKISSVSIYKGAGIGSSIAVDGVCLTIVEKDKEIMSFDVMEETVRRSALGSLKIGGRVNLEDAVRAGGEIGGHFVLGHIDCAGKIKEMSRKSGGDLSIEVSMPEDFSDLVVEKGSVAIDGVSLTIGEIGLKSFKVHIIPHTLKMTTLGFKKAGDKVNIEFDIIGKHAARMKGLEKRKSLTEDFLKNKGFI